MLGRTRLEEEFVFGVSARAYSSVEKPIHGPMNHYVGMVYIDEQHKV